MRLEVLCSPTIWLLQVNILLSSTYHSNASSMSRNYSVPCVLKQNSHCIHDFFPGMVSGVGMLPQGLPTAKRPRVALDEVAF